MATTTKTSRKPRKPQPTKTKRTKRTAGKPNAKSVKSTAKSTAAKTSTAKTGAAVANVTTPRSGQLPEFNEAAHAASALICVDEKGKPNKRAPLGTVQLSRVAASVGKRRKPSEQLRLLMFGGPKFKRDQTAAAAVRIARGWASSKIGQTDLPEGSRARFTAFAAEIGDPRKHKINGKALAAALVGLVDSPPSK